MRRSCAEVDLTVLVPTYEEGGKIEALKSLGYL